MTGLKLSSAFVKEGGYLMGNASKPLYENKRIRSPANFKGADKNAKI